MACVFDCFVVCLGRSSTYWRLFLFFQIEKAGQVKKKQKQKGRKMTTQKDGTKSSK